MARKKRSDSVLSGLPSVQKAQLRTWLIDENKGYDEVRKLLARRYRVRVGITAIRRFYATECFALRSSEATEFARQVVQEMEKAGQDFDTATLALVKKMAFERAYAKEGDLGELSVLAKIIVDDAKLELKRREVEVAERRVKLLEAEAARAENARKALQDESLTPEQRDQRVREALGIA